MAKPVVAIVGRPNVGKSTLVNRLIQSRDAIVHESRGVTRDRSYHETDWNGTEFVLIDTGGIESIKSKDSFAPHIREQALLACDEADVIVMLVDGSVGVTDEDEEVARVLRKSKKPTFLMVNKLDNPDKEKEALWPFYSLAIGEPLPLSAVHGHGTGDLLDAIVASFPDASENTDDDEALSVAIIGRPNVGKSSILNRLTGQSRSIVSDIAGTTRDAIDSFVEYDGIKIRLVDTAGMRKKSQVTEDVEYYSMVRGLQALDRADVALLVVDGSLGVTEQDQKLAEMAIERGCSLALLINKWDLVSTDEDREDVEHSIARRMTLAPWAPTLNVSALTGRSCDRILELAVFVARARATHIKTSELNSLVSHIRETGHTISERGKRLKINYITQTGDKPPVFSFWCNAPELVDDSYERYLENRLRERFDLQGTPIRMKFRNKS